MFMWELSQNITVKSTELNDFGVHALVEGVRIYGCTIQLAYGVNLS